MLILAKLLAEGEENLTDKQREFARTIYSSGSDLLDLINEILDLSKIESGMMEVEIGRVVVSATSRNTSRGRSGRSRTTRAWSSTIAC